MVFTYLATAHLVIKILTSREESQVANLMGNLRDTREACNYIRDPFNPKFALSYAQCLKNKTDLEDDHRQVARVIELVREKGEVWLLTKDDVVLFFMFPKRCYLR